MFARRYFEALNRVYRTLDTRALVGYFNPSCGVCRTFVSDVNRKVKAKHLHFSGGTYELLHVVAQGSFSAHAEIVRVDYSFPTQYLVDAAGQLVNSQSAESDRSVFLVLRWSSTSWQVSQLLTLEKSGT
jgi:hypothetical protein